jgi:hypothetical protein
MAGVRFIADGKIGRRGYCCRHITPAHCPDPTLLSCLPAAP